MAIVLDLLFSLVISQFKATDGQASLLPWAMFLNSQMPHSYLARVHGQEILRLGRDFQPVVLAHFSNTEFWMIFSCSYVRLVTVRIPTP